MLPMTIAHPDSRATRRHDKLVSLAEAARLVSDGSRVAFGGFTVYNRPMALARELVRQQRRGLTVVAMLAGPETELLAAGGCIDTLETSYVGLEKFGLAQRVRKLTERGELQLIDHSEVASFDRFRADGDNQTFVPVDYLAGSSLLTKESGIVEFDCPLTGRRLYAIPPAQPEVTVIHVPAADRLGNGLIATERLMPQDLDLVMAQSSRRLILTAERIVATEEFADIPSTVQIPAYRTEAVAFAPWGAHPGLMTDYYDADAEALEALSTSGREDETSRDYLDTNVHRLPDHDAYLQHVGMARLLNLLRRRP
jgi:glutaconate CoA-transferase subunit A